MSRVVIVATGGTIQNTSRGRISVDRVLADIRSAFGQTALPLGAQLEIRDVLRAGAEAFGPREWRRIATAVETAVRDPSVDGVVVTHGTFTAEETAYVLQLVIRSSGRSRWPCRSASTAPRETMVIAICSMRSGSPRTPRRREGACSSSRTRRFTVLAT